jgi:phenylalanyl-tRNA synthetase beta chain
MPVINFSYSDLCGLIGREIPKEVLRERLPMIGAEMKSVQDDSDELSFEFFPDRPDLYCVEGIARALRAFLGYEPGLRSYAVGESGVEVRVDPSVKDVRPYIWSAIVEGNEIDDPLIRSMMDLQEKLHVTIGRNRRKVAIGIHDFRAVKPPFTYKAVLPDEISFIPLQGTERMTPAEILQRHEKGMAYAFVLEGKERYPMIVDSEGEVLSFPPIINGIATAVTEATKDIFVDCTGTDINAVTSAVNILTSALAERGGKMKTVSIRTESGVHRAPDLAPRLMPLDVRYVNQWIGTALKPNEMVDCLKRMGYGAGPDGPNSISVEIPAYRADILHPVDLAEDVAVGYGFEKFGSKLPRHATFGVEDSLIAYSEKVRPILIGLGYFEVATLSLSNPREQYALMSLLEEEAATRIKNPVSVEHSLLRTSLLPSLLAILRKNKHRELPQRIFEIGDVVIDGVNRTYLSGVSIHAKASFTEGKSLIQSIFSALGAEASVVADSSPSFIAGRAAGVVSGSLRLGVFGELGPSTIESFELGYPIVAFELDLETLHRLGSGH